MFGQPYAQVARHLGATAITTILCSSAAQAQPAREADYALPAQSLARSLRDVSVRSGTSVIAPSDLVSGRQAPALRGRYGPRQAVEALLQGSGLRATMVGDALVVSRAGATAEGDAAPAPQLAESEPIIVTGTNLRGGQPTSPIIILRRAEIDASGSSSVEQLMAKVPQNAQNGVNRENFSVPGAGADPTEHGSGLNLRGLGQRATLVLINGRRVAPAFRNAHPAWFARGHLMMKFLAERLGEDAAWNTHTFYNAVPQRQSFNAGIWQDLENSTGAWAQRFGAVWVITGPIYADRHAYAHLGDSGEFPVAIPEALFKVVIKEGATPNRPDVLAFIYPQVGPGYSASFYNHMRFLTTVDEIEQLTGIDFLRSLPDDVEAQLERTQAPGLWPSAPANFIRACQGGGD